MGTGTTSPVPEAADAVRRVVLVGFMAAGKSSVGRGLAERMGWRFIDFDAEIERRSGRSVPELFSQDGEAAFRRMEAELTSELAGLTRVVLAPGGGWVAQPGLLDRLGPGSLVVWLRVSAEEAVRRSQAGPGTRPLLAGDEPLAAARRLLEAREASYARADWTVDVEGSTVDEVVDLLAERLLEAGVEGRRGNEPRSGGA